jgi:hypothetical protein
MYCTFRIKHPHRGHHYVLQNVLILQGVRVTLYKMENSSTFMGDPAPKADRHMPTAFAGTLILRIGTLSLRYMD